jgi:uncharacterized protein YcbX
MITVQSLHIYPVKSCRGSDVPSAEVVATGFRYDRQWMIVDPGGIFVSQRTHPELARVTTRLEGRFLTLEAPGLSPLEVALDRPPGARRPVRVWNDCCQAVSEGAEASEWFSSILGTECDLVRLNEAEARQVDRRYAQAGDRVAFADGFPFLLISQASVDELNRRLEVPVPADRFRANIVVGGCGAHAEDGWPRLAIGDIGFRRAKPCARCSVITTDQHDGSRSAEPLNTLAGYRLVGSSVLFGQNLVHDDLGTISVGDHVTPLDQDQSVASEVP